MIAWLSLGTALRWLRRKLQQQSNDEGPRLRRLLAATPFKPSSCAAPPPPSEQWSIESRFNFQACVRVKTLKSTAVVKVTAQCGNKEGLPGMGMLPCRVLHTWNGNPTNLDDAMCLQSARLARVVLYKLVLCALKD